MEGVAKSFDELTAEDSAEHLDGQKEGPACGDPGCVIRRESAGGKYAVDVRMKTSAPTIPCSRKAQKSRFSIRSIRFMALLFRSSAGPSGEMARSLSLIEAENG
jgi:hypothetical protein